MTAIILLNWNGYSDTIECLRSLYQMETDFFVIVVDNGSLDDSVRRISLFMKEQRIKTSIIGKGETINKKPANRECIIYDIRENLGFSKGNNEALRLIKGQLPEHVLLLNNDTIVEPDFLDELNKYACHHPDIVALTPLICYYADKKKVWNAGGKQIWGLRKYYYANRQVQDIKESSAIPVTFLTGCALFFSTDILLNDGGLFTERFFFGEEDFEFCLRMNNEKKTMACVLSAKIYHKVNTSVVNHSPIGKIYIYYLNRFVDMRQHISSASFFFWSRCYGMYVVYLLLHRGLSWTDSFMLLHKLIKRSGKDRVTREDFFQALKCEEVAEL